MRNIYVNNSVIAQVKKNRNKLWVTLIPMLLFFIIAFFEQNQESLLNLTGLTYTQALSIAMLTIVVAVWYAHRVWRCPVCKGYLSNNVFTKFCPHCNTYVAVPPTMTPVHTDDEKLYRGGAFLPPVEYAALMEEEKPWRLMTRYRRQIIFSTIFTVLVGGIAILADIQSDRVHGNFEFGLATIMVSVLYVGWIFSFCWSAIFLFYFDEWVLTRYNNRSTRVMMIIYNISVIKIAITLLGGMFLVAVTLGIFGIWVFFKTRSKLKALTISQVRQVA